MEGSDPELENYLLTLSEHPDERNRLMPRILTKLPWGFHPSLYVEKISNPKTRLTIRDEILPDLIREKRFADLEELFLESKDELDLVKGAFLLSSFSDEWSFTYEEFSDILDTYSFRLKERFEKLENPTQTGQVQAFIRFLFKDLKFTGITDSHSPENHYIHRVLENKKGGPIVLCILANRIAAGAGLIIPIVITAGSYLLRPLVSNEIPFIDPAQGGKIVSESEHIANVAQKGYDPSIGLIHITDTFTIYQRLARNLMQSSQMTGDTELHVQLKEFHAKIKELIRKRI